MNISPDWLKLRSDIYIRDKGICWICNTFVELKDYDLGHLIDRHNGGVDAYDNLAVMHKYCNLTKPSHNTLENAMKWKLTSFTPSMTQERERDAIVALLTENTIRRKQKSYQPPHISRKILDRRKAYYNEMVMRIKPSTLCWQQGSPLGGPMWKVLPPPYRQEDMFTLRMIPPGANDTLSGSIETTLQLIGGNALTPLNIEVTIGHIIMNVTSLDGSKLEVYFKQGLNSNTGEASKTIGMGKGQIPVEEWLTARKQGITIDDFKASYGLRRG